MLDALINDSLAGDRRHTRTCADGEVTPEGRREHTRSLFEDRLDETDDGRRKELFDEIVEINMGVSRSIARRYRDRGESIEDLEQVAYFGLLKAVGGFDSSRGRDFLVYAVPTIAGEVKRHFRDRCWVVRPPRRIQELKSRIAGCTEMLNQVLGHTPLAFEIADYLGETVGEVNEALRVDSCYSPTSLDVIVGPTGSYVRGEMIGSTDNDFDRVEIREMLKPLLSGLSETDRTIIALRFYEEWTQEQIARHLALSQMQVSRILARIMRSLRHDIGEDSISA